MAQDTKVNVNLTLDFKDVTMIRYAIGRIKCNCEAEARTEKDPAKKYEAQKTAEYLIDLEKKLYEAQKTAVEKQRREFK